MKLILEVKEHIQKSDEDRSIDATLKMVREAGLEAEKQSIFPSASTPAIISFATLPGAKVSYLNGDLTPLDAKDAGYAGIDYEDSVFYEHPLWIKEARNRPDYQCLDSQQSKSHQIFL